VTGVEVRVEGLSKSFGRANIWSDVTLTLPPGEVSVLLGPSGTGKSVFLKTLIGLIKPEKGAIIIDDVDLVRCGERKLYEIRKLFGVLFQDGALFGSMNLYDNIAFPLREHTRRSEAQIRDVVMEKMTMVGLTGSEDKLPGEISGGMRKRRGWPARSCSTRRSSCSTSPTPASTRCARRPGRRRRDPRHPASGGAAPAELAGRDPEAVTRRCR